MEYRVLRYNTLIGDKTYSLGDIVKHFDGYPWDQAIHNKAIEAVDFKSPKVEKKEPETKTPEKVSTDKEVSVVKAGIWYKVLDSNGELVGKATRNEEEANKIAEDYKNS